MPTYGLLCTIAEDKVKTLNDAKDKLCVGVPITTSSGEANPVIASTTDIKEGTILSWSDIIVVYVKDSEDNKSSAYEIKFGQTLKVKDNNYTVNDDSESPRYGFRFITDVGGSLEVHQKFGTVADSSFTTKWYDSGAQDVTWDPVFNVWFQSKPDEKLAVKFTKTTYQVVYCDEDGEWTLTGPHVFAAGAVVGISRGHGGYLITQPHSPKGGSGTNLKAPPISGSKNRYAISLALGPVALEGYIDIVSLEVGVDVSIIGIALGALYGNLRDGVVLHVNLIAASGQIRLYLNKPTQVNLSVDLDVKVGVSTKYFKEITVLEW